MKTKPHYILNKQIECKIAKEFENSSSHSSTNYEVFVGDLPLSCTDDDLVKYFSNFGLISKCSIQKIHGKSRGFGFVSFDNLNSVENVIRKKHKICNTLIECKIYQSNVDTKENQCKNCFKFLSV